MSFYNLQPSADISGKETLYAWWNDGFSDDEVNRIITIGENKIQMNGLEGVIDSGIDHNIRNSKVSWFSQQEAPWLYDKIGWIARQLNGQYFQYDISGFNDDLQYTVYNSEVEGHYDWHMDKGYTTNGSPPRKLSLVVLLSDPNEYEGGDLEIITGNKGQTLEKKKGMVHAFPSFVLHRVTPVTRGTRRSLVVWLCGPKWR
jgi:hypothetical protein